jgi:hypothetical protein
MPPSADTMIAESSKAITEADGVSSGEGPHAVGIGAPANAAFRRHDDG